MVRALQGWRLDTVILQQALTGLQRYSTLSVTAPSLTAARSQFLGPCPSDFYVFSMRLRLLLSSVASVTSGESIGREAYCRRWSRCSSPLLAAEVVQADFDQCGSMWMSVQPKGAAWSEAGWFALFVCVWMCGRELRYTVSCFSRWCITLTKCFLDLQMTLSMSVSIPSDFHQSERVRMGTKHNVCWTVLCSSDAKVLKEKRKRKKCNLNIFNKSSLCAQYSWMDKW